jgi:hypothetical protein
MPEKSWSQSTQGALAQERRRPSDFTSAGEPATTQGRALGVRNAKVKHVPKLVVRGLGLFNSIIRELPEMTYQWEVPFLVDDSRVRSTFGYGATPLDEQIAAVVAWAKPRFPVASSASATA